VVVVVAVRRGENCDVVFYFVLFALVVEMK